MFELKPLTKEAVPAALQKAVRYRLLNEPGQAESICRDVLEVEPENQEALVTLVLALSDQLDRRTGPAYSEARELLPRLAGEYERAYYQGILCERRAKALLRKAGPGSGYAAYDWIRQALDCYAEAEKLRPPGNDDAILRWNTCVRLLEARPELEPAPEETFRPFLE